MPKRGFGHWLPEHQLVEAQPVVGESGPTRRLEVLPPGWMAGRSSEPGRLARRALSDRWWQPAVVWRLEVWADDEQVHRIRYQTQDQSRAVVELCFVPLSEVLTEDGLRVPLVPSCPSNIDGDLD